MFKKKDNWFFIFFLFFTETKLLSQLGDYDLPTRKAFCMGVSNLKK